MDLPVNHFKRAIAERRQQLGIWNSITGSLTSEALATMGYDWILIDTEHSHTDVPDTLAMMQAIAAYRSSAVVRPADNDPVLIKRLLDLGAQSLLIPYVQNAEEARAAVAAVRYAPRGIRGMAGMTRAGRFGSIPDYATRAETEICVLVQVETVEALGQIEAIAAVDGIDGLFIGPADLAASMGLPGQLGHPDVVATIMDAIRRIDAAGKPAGILALDKAFTDQCLAAGTTFTAIGLDLILLVKAARALLADFRSS
jgi:4-hydroxy-2-oxoheptanedioate aldolase